MQIIFKRYRLLFIFFLPVLFVAGNLAIPLSVIVVAVFFGYCVQKNRHDTILMLFMVILIMGDSRQGWMQFAKPLRSEMLILIALLTFLELYQGKYRFNGQFLSLVPFLMVSFLALSFSPLLNLAITKTISFSLLYFVVLHYFVNKFGRFGIRFLGDIVYLCHFILALGLILLPILPSVVSYGGIRFNGLLGNPNGLGMFITMVTPMTIYFFRYQRGISQRYKTLAWSLIVISLLLCSSRNAIFCFTIFVALYYGLTGGLVRRIAFLFVLMPAAALFLFFLDLEALVLSLGLEEYFRLSDISSGSGRIYAWGYAWELIQQRPLLGCGFACEEYNFLYRTTYQLWSTGHQGGVHNSYLAFIVNTGFLGFGLFILFWGNTLRKVKNYFFLLPFLATIAFSAMFESWLFSSLSAFHILFLVIVSQLLADRYLPVHRMKQ